MGGPGSGRKKGSGSGGPKLSGGASKLKGKKVAFGKTKGYVSNKVAVRETNKSFTRRDKLNSKNFKRSLKG